MPCPDNIELIVGKNVEFYPSVFNYSHKVKNQTINIIYSRIFRKINICFTNFSGDINFPELSSSKIK